MKYTSHVLKKMMIWAKSFIKNNEIRSIVRLGNTKDFKVVFQTKFSALVSAAIFYSDDGLVTANHVLYIE